MSYGVTLSDLRLLPREQLIAANLRALADKCLYLDRSVESLIKLETYINKSLSLHPQALENYILMSRAFALFKSLHRGGGDGLDKQYVKILNKALEYDPKNTEVKLLLGRFFMDKGNLGLAEEYLKDVAELRSDSKALETLGDCAYLKDDKRKALEFYTKATQKQPRKGVIQYKRGLCLHAAGEHVEAYLAALKALLLDGGMSDAKKLMDRSLKIESKKRGSSEKAIRGKLESEFKGEDVEAELMRMPLESDVLTGFATDDSLSIWIAQTKVKEGLSVLTFNVSRLRYLSIVKDKPSASEYLAGVAASIREAFKSALVFARPLSDKLTVVISGVGLQEKILQFKDDNSAMSRAGIGLGVSSDTPIAKAFRDSLSESVKSESIFAGEA